MVNEILFGGFELCADDLITGFEDDPEFSSAILKNVKRCLKKVSKHGAAYAELDDTFIMVADMLERIYKKYGYYAFFSRHEGHIVCLISESSKKIDVRIGF